MAINKKSLMCLKATGYLYLLIIAVMAPRAITISIGFTGPIFMICPNGNKIKNAKSIICSMIKTNENSEKEKKQRVPILQKFEQI